jgi:AcrR family transcriptional regulator
MDTRERIIDTASRLFYTQGYNSTGINQVIKEADVAKASLYQHFHSKEDLLIEYLTITSNETEKSLRDHIAKYKTPKEKVLATFDFLAKFVKQTEYNGCNFLNVVAEIPHENEKVRSLIRKQKNGIRALFTEILKPAHKESLADELYLLFDAALITSRVHRDLWPVKTARKTAERIL